MMGADATATAGVSGRGGPVREWRRFKFPGSIYRYGGFLLALVFIAFSIVYLNIPLERFINMFGRVGALVTDRYYPPDVEYVLDQASVVRLLMLRHAPPDERSRFVAVAREKRRGGATLYRVER